MRIAWATLMALCLLLLAAGPATAQDDEQERIHLINAIPGQTVDVTIGGEQAVESFAFRDTEDLTGLSGGVLTSVTITKSGTDTVLLDAGNVDLPNSGNSTVLLHLKVDGSVGLSIFDNDVSRLDAGQSRLIIRHLADAPPVDVLAAGQVVFEGLANGGERSADLPAGDVSAELVPAGADGPTIIGPADLALLEGAALIVYGVGSLDDGTMEVVTEVLTGLDTAPSNVDTGNSPVGASGLGLSLGTAVIVGLVGVAIQVGLTRRAGQLAG